MNDDLTPEERALLARIEAAGRWDHLLNDLSLLVPAFIIVGLGIRFDSPAATVTGTVLYAVFALRAAVSQAKAVPVMKSMVGKLKRSGQTGEPPASGQRGAV